MKNSTMLLMISLTVLFSMSLGADQAVAEVHSRSFPLGSDASPAATPSVIMGIVALGTAVKGPAKINTTVTVGSVTTTGHATIIMH